MSSCPHHLVPPLLPPANCFTVLVVDDMLPNRVLLSKFLKSAGYAIVEAANGQEALDCLLHSPSAPDLIVTDIEMPKMDGVTFIAQTRALSESLSSIPIIAASGNADGKMKQEATAAGVDRFLTKPFNLKALSREMAALLKMRHRSPGRTNQASEQVPNRIGAQLPQKSNS